MGQVLVAGFIYLSLAHSWHKGLPPVPSRLFSVSMLLPVLHSVLSWWTSCLIECQGFFFMMVAPL